MGIVTRIIGLFVLILISPSGGTAQGNDDPVATDSFLAEARVAATRYADLEAATAAGYAPLGPEAPLMGEHWVHAGLIADGVYDAGRPSILIYATRAGRRELVGVAYAVVVDRGETPPPVPSGASWHGHVGTVEEELLDHRPRATGQNEGPRIAVFHAWVVLANPEGDFAADNPALPWWRLHLSAPPNAPADATRAASLAASGVRWYAERLKRRITFAAEAEKVVDRAFERTLATVRAELERMTAPGLLEEDRVELLGRAWRDLREDVAAAAPGGEAAVAAVLGSR